MHAKIGSFTLFKIFAMTLCDKEKKCVCIKGKKGGGGLKGEREDIGEVLVSVSMCM